MSVHYVPAGAEAYSNRRIQLQITNKPNEKESTDFGRTFKSWRTFNKTVSMVNTTNRRGVYSEDGQDVVVPVLNASHIRNCGLTKVLANPIHGDFVKAPFELSGIESIVDSGGFQLLKSTVDFVDMDELVGRYNANANIGMPLDLPVPASAEPFFFDTASKMMRANDKYMLSKLNPNVDLALISHGSTLALRKRRLDVLDRPAKVIAVAGLNIKPPPGVDHLIASAENLMYVIHRYHKTARYFHVLGVTSKLWLFVYSILDATKYVQSIGADSVSHRLGSLVGNYDTFDFNSIELQKDLTYRQTCPCTCPICVAVDDMRILNSSPILEGHNLWVRAEWTRLLSDMAKQYVAGKVNLKAVHSILRLRISLNEFTRLIRYVEEIIASDKFVPMRRQSKTTSLFAKPNLAKHPRHDHYMKVIGRYEKFHGQKFI